LGLKNLGANNRKFKHFLAQQVINKILFVWGPISSHEKPLRPKSKDKGFNPSYGIILFIMVSFFFSSLLLFLSKSSKSTTMDEHKHNIFVILVFFMMIQHVIVVVVAL
jgi:hypothetical protein